MKRIVILLLVLVFVVVNAQMNMMPSQAGPGNPIPNYMPLIMDNLAEIKVNNEQLEELKEWSEKTGPKVKAWKQELEEVNLQIKNDALKLSSLEDLLGLEQIAEELRLKIINSKVDCQENARRILDKKQWQQVLGLYNMSQVGTAKAEIYSPMPMLGMSLITHSGELGLNEEQSKRVAEMPAKHMPTMQDLEDQISNFYSLLLIASLEGQSKTEILELEHSTELKRIELIKAQANCRDNILDILTTEQWYKLLSLGNNMGAMPTMDHEEGAIKDEDIKHEHSTDSNMDHSQHQMANTSTSMAAANMIAVGSNMLGLEPIVSNDMLYLGLNFTQMEMAEIDFMITSPSDMEHKTLKLSNMNLLELGPVQAGIWRFAGKLHEQDINFSISVSHQKTHHSNVYLILAPSPSLSVSGKSEAFVYAFRDGASIHSSLNIKRNMPGMQHSSDHDELAMIHSHFDNRYNDILADAMANQSPINFMMVGNWEVEINIAGEHSESILFTIKMLDE